MAATDPDLDRRLDTIERQLIALANSLRKVIVRVDILEEYMDRPVEDVDTDQGTLL